MDEIRKMMPEALYSLDNKMSLEKLRRVQENGSFIIGHVLFWNSVDQLLRVNLGNNIFGSIPLNEISIYPTIHPKGILSPEIYTLIGNKVCVCVQQVTDSSIILSRKQNMLNTFDALSDLTGENIDCYIKSFQKTAVYVDVGHGISGRIHITDLCSSRLHHTSDIGIKTKDCMKVKVLHIDPNNFFIHLSYKELFEDMSKTLNPGDFVSATVLDSVNSDGYFAYINPSTPAIVNIPFDLPQSYGTKIVARVKSLNSENKLKLGFISFV